jgi:hypothetical protein
VKVKMARQQDPLSPRRGEGRQTAIKHFCTVRICVFLAATIYDAGISELFNKNIVQYLFARKRAFGHLK